MRKFILGFTCLIAASGACYAQTLVDRIVAVVDKEIITESELQDRVNFFAIQNRLDPTKPELRQQVLDALVTEKLILAQAILDSVQVSDEEVTRTLDQQIQNLVRQLGSEQRVEYTAIGDTTNTASRLEGMTKGSGSMIFISDTTRERMHEGLEDLALVGDFEVRGRAAKLTIWTIADGAPTDDADAPRDDVALAGD